MTNKQKIAELETKLRRYEKRAGDLLLRVLRTRGFCLTIFPARRNWLVAAILKLLVDIIQLFNIAVEIAERLMQRAIKAVHLARGVMSVNDGVQQTLQVYPQIPLSRRNTLLYAGRSQGMACTRVASWRGSFRAERPCRVFLREWFPAYRLCRRG